MSIVIFQVPKEMITATVSSGQNFLDSCLFKMKVPCLFIKIPCLSAWGFQLEFFPSHLTIPGEDKILSFRS